MRRNDHLKWMWLEAYQTLERADRLRRQFFQLGTKRSVGPSWEPPVDMFETERELCLLIALPGVDPEDVEVLQHDDHLIVSAGRPVPKECHAATIHRMEIPYGRFQRAIPLPEGRYLLSAQEIVNGCLSLRLRKL